MNAVSKKRPAVKAVKKAVSASLRASVFALPLLCSAPAFAAPGVDPQAWLIDLILEGRKLHQREITEDALRKLVMMYAEDVELQILWLQHHLEAPADARNEGEINEISAALCREPASLACKKAKLVLDLESPAMRTALAQVTLLETAGRYEDAVAAIESAFGGSAPEETSWRLHYYRLMLNIDGRKVEAKRGLAGLLNGQGIGSLVVKREADQILTACKIEELSNFALDNVYDRRFRSAALTALEEVLELAPDDDRVRRWQNAARDARFWLALEKGDAAMEAGRPWEAKDHYEKATELNPANPYPYLGLADVALQQDRHALAVKYTREALAHTPRDKAAERNRIRRKLATLEIMPAIEVAQAYAWQNEWNKALATIDSVQTDDAYHTLLKAHWASEAGREDRALLEYAKLLGNKDYRQEARISSAAILAAQGERLKAAMLLDAASDDKELVLTADQAGEAAAIYHDIGLTQRAHTLWASAVKTPGESKEKLAVLKRDWARSLAMSGYTEEALNVYREAFADVGLVANYAEAKNDVLFTRAMRSPDDETSELWEVRSIRTDAEKLYQKDNIILRSGLDYYRNEGTGGYSDVTEKTLITEAEFPLAGGRGIARVERVDLDVGRFDKRAGESKFGTGYESGFTTAPETRGRGYAWALAWEDEHFAMDIGRTPAGFNYSDWVGGASVNFDIDEVGATFSLYRRAEKSSLLAYGGQRDPVSGITWGGVRRTGAALNVSFDRGYNHGLWGKVSYELLRGNHVEDNSSLMLMGGYYYRLVNTPNHEVRLSTMAMYWSFDKNLSGYTLGQGGYYSPQQYWGTGFALIDRGRRGDWSWEAQAGIGLSLSKTEDSPRYPLASIVGNIDDRYAVEKGSNSTGISYRLQGALEHRFTPHWTAGLLAGASKARGYEPYYAMLYLRYNLKGWNGDMSSPPPTSDTMTSYASW